MEALQTLNQMAADYLSNVDTSLWVTAFYKSPYFRHKTSNVDKSINKVFKSE